MSSPAGGCSGGFCELGVWTGAEDYTYGSSGLAQGGSESNIDYGYVYYSIFYEFFPSSPVTCSSIFSPVYSGDTVVSEVSSQGSSYKVYVYDYSTGAVCNVTKNTTMSNAQYSLYVAEVPGGNTLPKFGSFTVYNAMTNYYPIYDYSPYETVTMNNVYLGPVQFSSSLLAYFTETYTGS